MKPEATTSLHIGVCSVTYQESYISTRLPIYTFTFQVRANGEWQDLKSQDSYVISWRIYSRVKVHTSSRDVFIRECEESYYGLLSLNVCLNKHYQATLTVEFVRAGRNILRACMSGNSANGDPSILFPGPKSTCKSTDCSYNNQATTIERHFLLITQRVSRVKAVGKQTRQTKRQLKQQKVLYED